MVHGGRRGGGGAGRVAPWGICLGWKELTSITRKCKCTMNAFSVATVCEHLWHYGMGGEGHTSVRCRSVLCTALCGGSLVLPPQPFAGRKHPKQQERQ